MRSEIPTQVVIVDWDKKTYAHELLTLQRTRIVFEGVNHEDAWDQNASGHRFLKGRESVAYARRRNGG